MKKILVVCTNVDQYEKVGYRTGLWLGELVHFYEVLEKQGYELDIASPKWGYIPLDPESLNPIILKQGWTWKYYKDRNFMNKLNSSLKLSETNSKDYEAIYLTWWHGTCFDFPNDENLKNLIREFFEAEKIVSWVCHGQAGFLNVVLSNGEFLIKGKKLTAFSWKEEKLVWRQNAVPFNLEKELENRGAKYSKAFFPMKNHTIQDWNLITGQNPMSARNVWKLVVKNLKK